VNIPISPNHPPIFSGGAQHRGFRAILPLLFLLTLTQTLRAADLAHLQSLVSQLGSDDPRVRETALNDLMDLKTEDLPTLRAAALSQSPLLPGQIAGLRQVVAQVFLLGEKYKIDPNDPSGFMGIQFSSAVQPLQSNSVVVTDRIQGFPAYRYLQSGDVIVQLIDRPGLQLNSVAEFINAVKLFRAGDVVRLGILRHGRAMTISVPLANRPSEITSATSEPVIDAWIQAREQRAEAYWNQEFSVLDPISAPATGQASTSAAP
jgi:hypothetical protein